MYGESMRYEQIFLAAFGATVAYFAFGFVVFGWLPLLREEYAKYPAIYRGPEQIKRVMPFGMLAVFVSIIILTGLYALSFRGGNGFVQGAQFGVLIGIFALCAFVMHNHVNLNIGWRLTLLQAGAYLLEWTIVGIVIGCIYKTAAP